MVTAFCCACARTIELDLDLGKNITLDGILPLCEECAELSQEEITRRIKLIEEIEG